MSAFALYAATHQCKCVRSSRSRELNALLQYSEHGLLSTIRLCTIDQTDEFDLTFKKRA